MANFLLGHIWVMGEVFFALHRQQQARIDTQHFGKFFGIDLANETRAVFPLGDRAARAAPRQGDVSYVGCPHTPSCLFLSLSFLSFL